MSLLWVTAVGAEPTRYISHHELADMYSGDYDVKMPHLMREMQNEWDELGPDHPDAHAGEVEHGGPRPYVEHLKKSIQANGFDEPLTVRGTNVVTDGNHRGVAALELRHPRIPVRDIR